jgi:hypothetical protein
MGVAATAMLSALAIDVTDAALLGAVAMGSFAAMSTPSPSSSKGSKNGGGRSVRAAAGGDAAEGAAAEEAAEGEVPRAATTIGNKASAPGGPSWKAGKQKRSCVWCAAWLRALLRPRSSPPPPSASLAAAVHNAGHAPQPAAACASQALPRSSLDWQA